MVWYGGHSHLVLYGVGGPCVHSPYRHVSSPFDSGFHDCYSPIVFPAVDVYSAHTPHAGRWIAVG